MGYNVCKNKPLALPQSHFSTPRTSQGEHLCLLIETSCKLLCNRGQDQEHSIHQISLSHHQTPSSINSNCNNLSLSESPPPSSSLLKLMKIKPKVENNHKELIEFKQTSIKGTDGSNGTSIPRKARRCWSPELHHRFVNALHQLGGPQGMPINDDEFVISLQMSLPMNFLH